jgi:hypothetical protein
MRIGRATTRARAALEPFKRQAVFAAVFIFLVVFQVRAISVWKHGVPACDPGRHTRLVGNLGGAVVAQTMRLETDGFSSVTVRARAHGATPRGDVRIDLVDITMGPTGERRLFRDVRPAGELVRSDTFTFTFPPLAASNGRFYRLEIRPPGGADGQGLALVASRQACYRDGMLQINGREQWGDLAFTAGADRDTIFRAVDLAFQRGGSATFPSRWSTIAAWLLFNVALAAFLWGLLVPPLRTDA